jgi:bacillithiol synthase
MMLRETLGESKESNEIIKLFEEAYLQHNTLSLATRYLVNALFGKHGLLVIDGNDKRLKQEFREILSEDLYKNSSFTKVGESDKALKALGYELQVNPRPINCFYLEKGLRARIESSATSFKVIGTEIQFNTGQLSELVKEHPEKFSPNVVLRPLYQQKLLPNLAYVGGPGELAYWLQFKSMFEHYGEFYPVLVPRSFVSVFDKSTLDKLRKLNFSAEELFLPEQELVRKLIARSEVKVDLEAEKGKLKSLYNEIQNKALLIDKSLETAVVAELQKALNGVQNVESKILKALKSRSETEINQVKSVKQKLFPGNLPQERHDNFAGYYFKYGEKFIQELEENLNPLLLKQIILCEEA